MCLLSPTRGTGSVLSGFGNHIFLRSDIASISLLFRCHKRNQSHVWAIKDTLHISPSSIYPIVVFLNGADLHCNTNSTVLYTGQLLSYILSHKTIAFTADGVERLSQRLSENIVSDTERKQKHIHSVRQNITERELQVANMICPRCKGRLVERHGEYGRFLGCSNYPRCKFTTHM